MKKVAALIAVMLVMSIVACAEGVDLSSYSIDDLINLKTAIDQELIDRNYEGGFYLNPGIYVIGEDIEAGRYTFRCVRLMKKWASGGIGLFESVEDEKPYEDCVLRPGDEDSSRLVEGHILKILGATCAVIKE